MEYDNIYKLKSYFEKLQLNDPIVFNSKDYYLENILYYSGYYKDELEYWLEIIAQRQGQRVYLTCDYGNWSAARESKLPLSDSELLALTQDRAVELQGKRVKVLESITTKLEETLAPYDYATGRRFKLVDVKVERDGLADRFLTVEIDPQTLESSTYKTRKLTQSESKKLFSKISHKLDVDAVTKPYSDFGGFTFGSDQGDYQKGKPSLTTKLIGLPIFIAYLFFSIFGLDGCDEDRRCYRDVKQSDGSIRKESVTCSRSSYRSRRYYGK